MKTPNLIFSLFILLLFSSAVSDSQTDYTPVLMKRADLERSVVLLEARAVKNPGKIYYKDQMIFLNEKYKGVHIIDNHDPLHPVNIGFLNIPGCLDIAIKNSQMFADNATDLVSIDLSIPGEVSVSSRKENVFPERTPPDLTYIPARYTISNRPENTIIVGWERTDK